MHRRYVGGVSYLKMWLDKLNSLASLRNLRLISRQIQFIQSHPTPLDHSEITMAEITRKTYIRLKGVLTNSLLCFESLGIDTFKNKTVIFHQQDEKELYS